MVVATLRAGDPHTPPARGAAAPADFDAALAGFDDRLATVLDLLASTDPAAPVWNFTPIALRTAAFWSRREAHEITVHRLDAQAAAGGIEAPLDPDFAADGIDEVLDTGWFFTRQVVRADSLPFEVDELRERFGAGPAGGDAADVVTSLDHARVTSVTSSPAIPLPLLRGAGHRIANPPGLPSDVIGQPVTTTGRAVHDPYRCCWSTEPPSHREERRPHPLPVAPLPGCRHQHPVLSHSYRTVRQR
jgi:hypothetical protein